MHTQRRQQVIVSRRHDSSLASLAATTMRRLLLPFLLLPLCTMTVGCHSYLTPVGSEPIAALPVETVGGDLLEVDGEGKLWVRPGRDRIGAALGVQLAENAQGVVVSASSPSKADGKIIDTHDWVSQDLPFPHLAAGDRIVTVAAVVPPSGWPPTRSFLKRLRKRGLGNIERKIIDTHDWVSQDLPFEALHPRTTWQEVRSAPQAHDIDTLDDLQGYTSAYGWLTLDLAVEFRHLAFLGRHHGQGRADRLGFADQPVIQRAPPPSRAWPDIENFLSGHAGGVTEIKYHLHMIVRLTIGSGEQAFFLGQIFDDHFLNILGRPGDDHAKGLIGDFDELGMLRHIGREDT